MTAVLVLTFAVVVLAGLWAVARRRHPGGTPRDDHPAWVPTATALHDELVRAVRGELVRRLQGGGLDWSRPIEDIRRDVCRVAEHLMAVADPLVNRGERDRAIADVVAGVKPPE